MVSFTVNGQPVQVDASDDTPLLWVLRDHLNLTGTKFGCGIAACGACTVHFDGQAVRSCVIPVSVCAGKRITTIEGLTGETEPHPLQQAWIEQQVSQCGYCQSGMIMAASALLAAKPDPSETDIAASMTNICRCGTYPRIKRAILSVANKNGANALDDPPTQTMKAADHQMHSVPPALSREEEGDKERLQRISLGDEA